MHARALLSLLTLVLAALALPPMAGAAPSQTSIPVSGAVQDAGGAPVEGARVFLIPLASAAEQGRLDLAGKTDPEPVATAATGADGRFRVNAPEAGMWKVAVQARGMVPEEHLLAPLTEETELAAVRLERDLGLEVRVTGADGKPLSGARVRVSDVFGRLGTRLRSNWLIPVRAALTDAKGVAVLPRGAKERLLVQAGIEGQPFAEANEVRAATASLRLPGAVPREIRVLDAAGKNPVAGVLVRVGENRWCTGVTSSDGKLAVPLAAGRREKLFLRAENGSWLESYVEPLKPEEKGPKTFRLPGLEAVNGRVVSALDGRPVSGALVWFSGDLGSLQKTGADGGWRLQVPPGQMGEYQVSAAAAGFLKADAPLGDGRRGPTLALEPAVAAAGVVVDEKGQPVEGAEVRASPRLGGGRIRGIAAFTSGGNARTGASGRFRIGGLSTETGHDLRFTRSGFAPATAEVPPLEAGRPAADLRIVLRRGRTGFGRVLNQSEQPIAGAEIVLRPTEGGDVRARMMRRFSEPEKYETAADAAGRFELRDLPAGTFDLTARGSGYAPLTVPGLAVPEGGGATDLGTVMLAAGVAVEGWVVDPQGQPVAGAEIVVEEASADPMRMFMGGEEPAPAAVSGEDGFFRVADRRAGELVDLQASRPGYAPGAAEGVQVPPDPPVRLVLQLSSTVEGRTVDPDGKPVPGARVFAMPDPMARRGMRLFTTRRARQATSDEEGYFRLEDVIPGGLELHASAPGRQNARVENLEVRPAQNLKGVELVLAPGATIEGRVLSPSGQPVIGAQVSIMESSRMFFSAGSDAVSDGEGRYRLEAVPPGTQNVEAEHKSYRRAVKEIEVRLGENTLDLRLEGGFEISGRVVDEGGVPVPSARVSLREGWRSWNLPSDQSGPDGSFTLTGVAEGTYKLLAEKQGFATQEGQDVTVAGSSLGGVEVKLSAGGAIFGQLSGLEFTELAQVRVGLERGFGGMGQVSADGSYRIEHVAPGEHRVVASLADDSRQAEGKVTLEPGAEEVRLDLDFGGGLTLTGRVLRNGQPAPGQRIGLDGAGSAGRWGSTDHEGRFRFEGLDAGHYELRVYGSRIESSHQEELDLTSDRDVLIELETVAISGRVVDSADHSPIHNATVSIVPPGEDTFPMQTSTDARGSFRLRDVAAGSWKLRAILAGYAPGEMDVQVGSDPIEGIELELQATEGVVLEVLLASGRPPETVNTAVLDPTGRVVAAASYPTGEDGRVRIASVAPGSWEVLLDADGSAPISLTVTAPGNAGRVILPQPGGLNLKVPALAAAKIGAKAALVDDAGKPFRAPWGYEAMREFPLSGGARRFDRLPPGNWSLTVKADDGRTWTGRATVTPGGMAEVTLE